MVFQIEIYEDNDNARKDDIAVLGGQTENGINVFSVFYDRLKEVISAVLLVKIVNVDCCGFG